MGVREKMGRTGSGGGGGKEEASNVPQNIWFA